MDFSYYLQIFLKRLPILAVMMVLGSIIGVAIAMSIPPTYRAEATLVVESEQIPDELARTTVSTSDTEALQIIQQRIRSRAVLLELANDFEIYRNVKTREGRELSADAKVSDMRDRIRINSSAPQRRGVQQATIVRVSFQDTNPERAANVTNEIVTLILQENVQMRTSVTTETLSFFTQEVERLEQLLNEASADILAFKEANLQSLPDSLQFRRSRQVALQERIVQIERDKTELRDRRSQLTALFEATGRTGLGNGQASPEARNLADLRQQYASLSAVLSDNNPRMALLRSQIAAAESALEASLASGLGADADPAQSLFEIEIGELDTQIAYLEDQQARIEAEMEQLSQSIGATPENSITLESLERNYDNIQARYDRAITNKSRAETGNIIETLAKGSKITVLDNATAPSSPTSPNRPKIAMAGFGMGTMVGFGIIALLELINPAIRRPEDIQSALGVDVFASIPYIRTDQEIRRRRMLVTASVIGLVVSMPLALWYINSKITPLASLIDRIL